MKWPGSSRRTLLGFPSVEARVNTATRTQVRTLWQLYYEGFPDVSHVREGGSRYQPAGGSAANPNPGGDPFTGGSRYQPAVNTSVPSQAGGVDPFTGGSRYQPSPSPSGPAQGGYSDPFTGANRYQATPSPAPSTPVPPTPSSSNVIPHVRLGAFVSGGDLLSFPKLENADHLQAVQHPCNAGEVDGVEQRGSERDRTCLLVHRLLAVIDLEETVDFDAGPPSG